MVAAKAVAMPPSFTEDDDDVDEDDAATGTASPPSSRNSIELDDPSRSISFIFLFSYGHSIFLVAVLQ